MLTMQMMRRSIRMLAVNVSMGWCFYLYFCEFFWGVYPFVVFFDELDELFDCFCFWYVEFDGSFVDVEVDFVRCSSDVAEVCVCHFSWSVDDASHDGDANSFEVSCGGTDFLGCFLEVE